VPSAEAATVTSAIIMRNQKRIIMTTWSLLLMAWNHILSAWIIFN